MNKDKQIKDLRRQNDKLKMQYEYMQIRACTSENQIKNLKEEIKQLTKKNENLIMLVSTTICNKIRKELEDANIKEGKQGVNKILDKYNLNEYIDEEDM